MTLIQTSRKLAGEGGSKPRPHQFGASIIVPSALSGRASSKILQVGAYTSYRHVASRNFLLGQGIFFGGGNKLEGAAHVTMHIVQESCAITKTTARCALYIAALKILESP